MNVLDSSYIKTLIVRWPCLQKYFWFLVTPQRWSNPPQSLVHMIICLHIAITLWSFVIVSFTRPRSLGWLDDCVGKSPKRRLVGGTGTYNKSGWWWWWYVFACLSVTSLPRIVSRLGLRCVLRCFKSFWQVNNVVDVWYIIFLHSTMNTFSRRSLGSQCESQKMSTFQAVSESRKMSTILSDD